MMMIYDNHDDSRRLAPEPPAGAAPDAPQRLAAAPAFDRPPGAAQVAMRRPAAAAALRRPAGAADAALRRLAASIGLTVAEPAAKKPQTFASSVQEVQVEGLEGQRCDRRQRAQPIEGAAHVRDRVMRLGWVDWGHAGDVVRARCWISPFSAGM